MSELPENVYRVCLNKKLGLFAISPDVKYLTQFCAVNVDHYPELVQDCVQTPTDDFRIIKIESVPLEQYRDAMEHELREHLNGGDIVIVKRCMAHGWHVRVCRYDDEFLPNAQQRIEEAYEQLQKNMRFARAFGAGRNKLREIMQQFVQRMKDEIAGDPRTQPELPPRPAVTVGAIQRMAERFRKQVVFAPLTNMMIQEQTYEQARQYAAFQEIQLRSLLRAFGIPARVFAVGPVYNPAFEVHEMPVKALPAGGSVEVDGMELSAASLIAQADERITAPQTDPVTRWKHAKNRLYRSVARVRSILCEEAGKIEAACGQRPMSVGDVVICRTKTNAGHHVMVMADATVGLVTKSGINLKLDAVGPNDGFLKQHFDIPLDLVEYAVEKLDDLEADQLRECLNGSLLGDDEDDSDDEDGTSLD